VIDRHQLTPKSGPYEFKELNLFTLSLSANKSMDTNNEELDCSYWKHHPFRSTETAEASASIFYPTRNAYGEWEESDETDHWVHHANRYASAEVEDIQSKVIELPLIDNKNKVTSVPPSLVNKLLARLEKPKSMTFLAWTNMKIEYPDGQKLKVIVDDLTEADDAPKTHNFMMIGRTLDQNHAYVMFPFTESDFSKVVAMANEGVFEVEVNGHAWRRTEPGNTDKKHIADFQGVAVINAVNPTAIYTQEATHNAD
jgi:hypothetical protein